MQPTPAPRRLRFIDDLRALAACSVMLFHFVASGVLYPIFQDRLWHPLFWLAQQGWLGVHIFFVLSGFVIALSIGDEPVTPGYVGRFIARRSLRLDPPYWVTVALTVLMLYVFNMFMRRHDTAIPTVTEAITNLTYTMGIFHEKPVLPVLWTLCLEVQFYLLLIGILFVDQWVRRRPKRSLGTLGAVLFWIPTVLSTAMAGGWVTKTTGWWSLNLGSRQFQFHYSWLPSCEGWFIDNWCLFAFGAVLSWTMSRRLHPAWLVGFVLAMMGIVYTNGSAPIITALGTVAAILVAAVVGRLQHGVGGRPVLFLGTISYSTYLIHALVGPQVLGYGAGWLGRWFGLGMYVLIPLVFVALAICIGLAWLMHKYVERPGIEVGKRFRHRAGIIPVVRKGEPAVLSGAG